MIRSLLSRWIAKQNNLAIRDRLVSKGSNIHLPGSYLFVHVPKSAGTSVYTTLGFKASGHYLARDYQKFIGRKAFKRFFVFSIVRHPIERFWSLYNYARMETSFHHSAVDSQKAAGGVHRDYNLLINAGPDECVRLLIGGYLRHNKTVCVWRPQVDWLYDEDGTLLVDFIGRHERLDEDFSTICERIGVKGKSLPRLNESKSSTGSKGSLSDESMRLLRLYYARDFELLGYS